MTTTMNIEKKLAEKFKYKKLTKTLSDKYRKIYRENIPEGMKVEGEGVPLFSQKGTKICTGYTRIVIGDYGAYVEITPEQICCDMIVKPCEKYRLKGGQYVNVKYVWYTLPDENNIKIYFQKNTVDYADYKIGMYYISPNNLKLKNN